MKNLIALSLLFVASAAFADVKTEAAQIEKRQQACLDNPDNYSTAGMNGCLDQGGQEMDALLNKTYRSIVKKLSEKASDEWTKDYNKEGLSRLVASERAWIKSRDADVSLMGMINYGGTASGQDMGYEYFSQTKTRALKLVDVFGE